MRCHLTVEKRDRKARMLNEGFERQESVAALDRSLSMISRGLARFLESGEAGNAAQLDDLGQFRAIAGEPANSRWSARRKCLRTRQAKSCCRVNFFGLLRCEIAVWLLQAVKQALTIMSRGDSLVRLTTQSAIEIRRRFALFSSGFPQGSLPGFP